MILNGFQWRVFVKTVIKFQVRKGRTVPRLRAGNTTIVVRFPARETDFSFLQKSVPDFGSHPSLYSVGTGGSSRVKADGL